MRLKQGIAILPSLRSLPKTCPTWVTNLATKTMSHVGRVFGTPTLARNPLVNQCPTPTPDRRGRITPFHVYSKTLSGPRKSPPPASPERISARSQDAVGDQPGVADKLPSSDWR